MVAKMMAYEKINTVNESESFFSVYLFVFVYLAWLLLYYCVSSNRSRSLGKLNNLLCLYYDACPYIHSAYIYVYPHKP